MEKERQRSAKEQMIAFMQAGHPWQEAAVMAEVQIGRSAAYHLLREVRRRGAPALQDGRHGHPTKLREPVREWLETTCREAPQTPSRVMQTALQKRFGILVSIGHLNRIRAKLDVGSRAVHREKNFDSLARRRNRTGKKEQVGFSL
jgi:transposase